MNTSTSNTEYICSSKGLNEILQDLFKLPLESISDDMTMAEVPLWDSLRHMELILEIEQKFDLQLTFEEISTMQSIGAIRKLIQTKVDT